MEKLWDKYHVNLCNHSVLDIFILKTVFLFLKTLEKNVSSLLDFILSCGSGLHNHTFSFHYSIFILYLCEVTGGLYLHYWFYWLNYNSVAFFDHLKLVIFIKLHYVLFCDHEGYSTFFWSPFCHWWFKLCIPLLGLL